LAVLAATGALTASHLLVLTLAVGIGTALNAPSWQTSIRDQVSSDDLPAAIALNSIGFNLARSMGPAIGGLLVAFAGPTANFTINAASYLAVIIVLLRWTPPPASGGRMPLLAAMREGTVYAVQQQPMRNTMLRAAIFGLLTAALWALMPLVARDLLSGGSLEYGLLLGAFGVGSVFGAFLAIRARRHLSNQGVFVAASLGFALATAALALSPSLAASIAAAALAGSCWVSALSTINIAVQTQTPLRLVGRCLALYYMAAFGGLAIGSYGWGLAADGHGIAASLLASAVLLALSTLMLQRFRLPGGV
jgi:MFS family permease